MENILNSQLEFDVELFDKIVQTALSGNSDKKKEAENVLIRFKELPNSWTRVDAILKSNASQQSKFIALQILEETVKCKWAVFDDSMKIGLRQYIFSYIVSNPESTIVLNKFNKVLVEIVKKDWPRKWPSFITELISVSQSTSMAVSSNSLEILKMVNEDAFLQSEDITTAKKRLLRTTLKNEYYNIFSFISMILEYSEKQELEDHLLVNSFDCFTSFCKSMPPEYIFSTRIVEIILNHLNSPHSIKVLECLLEVTDLFSLDRSVDERITVEIPAHISQAVVLEKISAINDNCIDFFQIYLSKFQDEAEFIDSYPRLDDMEKLFVKSLARVFCSIYKNYFTMLNSEKVKKGLRFMIVISKVKDQTLFSILFDTWAFLIKQFYLEYPERTPTNMKLQRTEYEFVMKSLVPIFISVMPRPEQIFIIVNDLGEVIKDKNIPTSEIEFYKMIKQTLYHLSFCIEFNLTNHLELSLSRFTEVNRNVSPLSMITTHSYEDLNKLCWTVGSLANALDPEPERSFFCSILRSLLTLCEIKSARDEKAIVASNIMFIIGQFHRFLKRHFDFLFVVVHKLFDFLEEDYEGINEMVCDNFARIVEGAACQFYFIKDGVHFIDSILQYLPLIKKSLDLYLQRSMIDSLFTVLSIRPNSKNQAELITSQLTDSKLFEFNASFLNNYAGVKAVCHLFETYTLGFTKIPEVFEELVDHKLLIKYYQNVAVAKGQSATIVKTSLLKLLVETAKNLNNGDFLKEIQEIVLVDYKNSFQPGLITLTRTICNKNSKINSSFTQNSTSIIILIINEIISPSVSMVSSGDNNPDVTIEFLKLMIVLLENYYQVAFPILMNSEHYDAIINSILNTAGCIKEVSDQGLLLLTTLFKLSFENGTQAFFNRFLLSTIENLLGLVFDKDSKQNHRLQVELLFDLINYSREIGPISQGSNFDVINNFLKTLFTTNFRNLTENSLLLFSRGLFQISDKSEFINHLDDFSIKIYEFGSDDDLQEEIDILQERIAKKHI